MELNPVGWVYHSANSDHWAGHRIDQSSSGKSGAHYVGFRQWHLHILHPATMVRQSEGGM
jgi:hypothetical protein